MAATHREVQRVLYVDDDPVSRRIFEQQNPGARMMGEGRYSEAAKGWLDSGPFEQLSADTLFNIGNAAYRMGSPGEAALYYRRALAIA